jgi:hypothetical protein
MTSAADIDALIQQLHEIKAQLGLYAEIEGLARPGRGNRN